MKIRLYNAKLLTMEQEREIFDGEVWVFGERIIYVGESGTIREIARKCGLTDADVAFDREIDCEGNLLMPGFKNAHTHSGMTALRSYADDLPLNEWLNQQVFPIEAKMTPEDIKELSKLAILEYLTSGITAVFEMYLTPESIAEAFEEMGMRCVQVCALNNFSQSTELMEEMYRKLNQPGSLNSYKLGFHAEYTCSKELLEKVAALAHQYQASVYTHLAETEAEVAGCIERYGMTPLAFLDSLGMFDYGGGIYHGVHMSPEDFAIMKKRGLYIVTNPASNAKLASGIAPVSGYLRQEIPVAIGTDGPASNNCLDMFREMFLVTALAKLREKDASAVDAREVLRMATVNGAHAMGLQDCDVLAAGKYADLIMIDLHMPNMQPIHNICKNLVYSGCKSNVKMTMINGRILYENGRFADDEQVETIYRNCERITRRLCKESASC